tara:strand:- start:2560 stop:3567 length:1008 start_codon:yes stop_codon:yes gene_type:complete
MNNIQFININNIFNKQDNLINNNYNQKIINIINHNFKKNINNDNNYIYIGNIINNKPIDNSLLCINNKFIIKGFIDNNINNIQNCYIEFHDIILKGNIINQHFSNGDIIYKNTDEKFIGEFNKQGIPNGYCNYINDTKNIYYEGNWLNGNFHGLGTYKNLECEYTGLFNNNLFDGLGFIKYYNNYSYQGLFKNNKKSGEGKFIDLKTNEDFYVNYDNDNIITKITYLEKQNQDLNKENKSLNKLLQSNDIIFKQKNQEINELKTKNTQLEAINIELQKKSKCVVCYTENVNVLLPCSHACLCNACELHIRAYSDRRCPLCRKIYVVASLKKVIIS